MSNDYRAVLESNANDAAQTPWQLRPLMSRDDFSGHWNEADILLLPPFPNLTYRAGFACSDRCVKEVLRLRYEIFNVELGEGLSQSSVTGHDRDEFDDQMTHLVLYDESRGRIVGTYRVQSVEHALRNKGIYTAQLFQLSGLDQYHAETIEVGRACLAIDHRTLQAILALWTGLGEYMNLFGLRYLFGCCSLTTQDPDDGWRAMKTIRKHNYLHPEIHAKAQPAHTCGDPAREFDPELGAAIPLPKLFRTYMRMGAKVISEPAIDREFGTVDFIVFLDAKSVTSTMLEIVK